MRIVSWNINGIRAVSRKNLFFPMLEVLQPDVLLLQETKAHLDQVPEATRTVPSYHSFFNSHQSNTGYSGTAIYTKRTPTTVTYGMGIDRFDCEGRVVTAFYENLSIVNVYIPNGGRGPERLAYKLDFYDAFLEYLNGLRKQNPVVWGGDVNTAHEAIDLARPKENEGTTGFLPEERAWLDAVETQGWTDSFRHIHPTQRDIYTYWDTKTRARDRNVGWRIDYLFISSDLLGLLSSARTHNEIMGSDHCPISITLR